MLILASRFKKTHCRCRSCEARQVLRRSPDGYIRPPKCRVCGARNWRRDAWMNKRRQVTCSCGGYWFTHRQGAKFCHYRADGSLRLLGDADCFDRWAA